MKNLRNLVAITVLCLASVQTADAGRWFSWGNAEQKSAASKDAEKRYKGADKALKMIKHNAKTKGNGFAAEYALAQNEGTFYADLAKNTSLVGTYADFAANIYKAVALTGGQHMNVAAVAEAIGQDRLHDAGFTVLGTFKRWDGASEQFSGALLFNVKENTILIAFAGTASAADGYYDFAFTKALKDNLNIVPSEDYNVHQGFAKGVVDGFKEFKPLFDDIVGEILQRGDVKVITTGHSLGGAMSLIAADWIHRTLIREHNLETARIGHLNEVKVQNISFGAPRAYAKKTAREVENRLGKGNVIRLWNSIDIVPAIVSGKITGSKHVGLNFMVQDSFLRRTIPGLGYHSMTWYAQKAQETFEQAVLHAHERTMAEANYKFASEAVLKAKMK